MGVDEEWTVKRIQIRLEVQIYTIIGYSIDLTESGGTEQKIKRGGLDGRKFSQAFVRVGPFCVFKDTTGWRLMGRAAGQDYISPEQDQSDQTWQRKPEGGGDQATL